jgi:hypothetical protein
MKLFPTDPRALKQPGEWAVGDLPARARQAHMGIPVHNFPDCPCAPVVVFHGARDHGSEPIAFTAAGGWGQADCWGP